MTRPKRLRKQTMGLAAALCAAALLGCGGQGDTASSSSSATEEREQASRAEAVPAKLDPLSPAEARSAARVTDQATSAEPLEESIKQKMREVRDQSPPAKIPRPDPDASVHEHSGQP